jgi:hypothetical protein
VKPSHTANNNLIDRTLEVWRPRVGRDLSCDGARQIAENVIGFFAILAEWSRIEVPAPSDNVGDGATSDEEAHHDR